MTKLLNSLAPLRSHASPFLSQLSVSHLNRASEGLVAAAAASEEAGVLIEEEDAKLLSSPLLLAELVLVLPPSAILLLLLMPCCECAYTADESLDEAEVAIACRQLEFCRTCSSTSGKMVCTVRRVWTTG